MGNSVNGQGAEYRNDPVEPAVVDGGSFTFVATSSAASVQATLAVIAAALIVLVFLLSRLYPPWCGLREPFRRRGKKQVCGVGADISRFCVANSFQLCRITSRI